MGRTRAVDRELVLDRAVGLFWSSGFAGTSLADLESATGLGRSSLYQDHTSKRALYLTCLQRYQDRVVEPELAQLQEPGAGGRALRSYLITRADQFGHGSPRGCFMAGAMAELGPLDPDVRRLAGHHQATLETALTNALRGAATSSKAYAGAGRLARQGVATLLGLAVVGRTDPAEAARGCEDLAEAMLGR